MRILAALLRRRPKVAVEAQSGQIVLLFALALTVLLGMTALGVDLGHAVERHQFIQGAANNTARAGAFEAYSQAVGSQSDATVVNTMVDTLRQSGLSVANYDPVTNKLTSFSFLASRGSACPGHLGPTQVYLEAQYIDVSNAQIGRVGTGASVPALTRGVQVTHLALCVPSFFSGVLGRKNFDVGSGDLAGNSQAVDAFGSTPDSPSVASVAPFYAYGHYCPIGSGACPTMPFTLFAAGAANAPGPGTQPGAADGGFSCPDVSGHNIPCSGDLITIHNANNGGSRANSEWDVPQFLTTADGLNNAPEGFPVTDGSNRGCLDPNVGALSVDEWSFNHGGSGNQQCASPPNQYDSLVVPLIDSVCKNGGYGNSPSHGPTPDCAPDPSVVEGVGGTNGSTCVNGGYCVRVVGFVVVYIATVNGGPGGNLVQGYITKVLQDPYCIVQTKVGEHPSIPSSSPFAADGSTNCPGELPG